MMEPMGVEHYYSLAAKFINMEVDPKIDLDNISDLAVFLRFFSEDVYGRAFLAGGVLTRRGDDLIFRKPSRAAWSRMVQKFTQGKDRDKDWLRFTLKRNKCSKNRLVSGEVMFCDSYESTEYVFKVRD